MIKNFLSIISIIIIIESIFPLIYTKKWKKYIKILYTISDKNIRIICITLITFNLLIFLNIK